MKKAFSLVIASALLATEPLMAMDAQATIPKELSDIGITAEDLKDVGKPVVDQPTKAEAEIMQRRWRYRYCPRGYRLQVYRVRIGRFIVTRYRCVRRYWRDRWDDRWNDGYYQAPVQTEEPVIPTPEK